MGKYVVSTNKGEIIVEALNVHINNGHLIFDGADIGTTSAAFAPGIWEFFQKA